MKQVSQLHTVHYCTTSRTTGSKCGDSPAPILQTLVRNPMDISLGGGAGVISLNSWVTCTPLQNTPTAGRRPSSAEIPGVPECQSPSRQVRSLRTSSACCECAPGAGSPGWSALPGCTSRRAKGERVSAPGSEKLPYSV